MTEQEAIEILKTDSCYECSYGANSSVDCCYTSCRVCKASKEAIKALEEVRQYRTIGTVEECREAVEKMKPKKIVSKTVESCICPTCGNYEIFNYCGKCGQKIEW